MFHIQILLVFVEILRILTHWNEEIREVLEDWKGVEKLR
jgi:hypothetical protein